MSSTPFLIGPVPDGARQDLKPFAIPEASFESLLNCYQFRGRVTRREGYTTIGRLQQVIVTGTSLGTITYATPIITLN